MYCFGVLLAVTIVCCWVLGWLFCCLFIVCLWVLVGDWFGWLTIGLVGLAACCGVLVDGLFCCVFV